MINPGARRAICRSEVAAIRRRLNKQHKPRLKSARTDEERRQLRLELASAIEKAAQPYGEIQILGWCVKCDYILFGLDKSRCPECGTEFDPTLLKELDGPPSEHKPSPQTLY